jgi:hypothetical protein
MSMNPATTMLSSIANVAVTGIARLIFPTRTGILAHLSRVSANPYPDFAPNCSSARGKAFPTSPTGRWRLHSSCRVNS